MVTTIQRIENAAIAVATLLAVVAFGQPWWLLLAAFLLFDLSAVGYLRGSRAGAVTYNAVHNYAGPAITSALYLALLIADHHAPSSRRAGPSTSQSIERSGTDSSSRTSLTPTLVG